MAVHLLPHPRGRDDIGLATTTTASEAAGGRVARLQAKILFGILIVGWRGGFLATIDFRGRQRARLTSGTGTPARSTMLLLLLLLLSVLHPFGGFVLEPQDQHDHEGDEHEGDDHAHEDAEDRRELERDGVFWNRFQNGNKGS